MSSVAHDCCCKIGKMREGRHDFMARIEDEIIVIKDVTARSNTLWKYQEKSTGSGRNS